MEWLEKYRGFFYNEGMKRFLLVLLLPLALFAAPLKLELFSEAAILINAETGIVLFEKNAHRPVFPASITKIATALYVLEKKADALGEMATATQECLSMASMQSRILRPWLLEAGGTAMGLRVGEVVEVKQLLYGLLLSSGNDAANVLANHLSGSVEKFMGDLNQFLREKGIKGTNFTNPHGLHHPDHQTTAYDMAQITRLALKYPLFCEIVKTVRFTRPPSNKQKSYDLVQGNKLLKKGKYYYPRAIGVKTGHIEKAGFTLSAAAEHEGRTLIAILLGCKTFDERYRDAIKLFDTAFKEKRESRTFFTKEHDHFWLDLKRGKNRLEAALDEDLTLAYYPAEELDVKTQLKWDFVRLPIHAGQLVGRLELVTDDGTCIKSQPLFAVRGVEIRSWAAFIDICTAYKVALISFSLCLFIMAGLFYLLKKPKKVI